MKEEKVGKHHSLLLYFKRTEALVSAALAQPPAYLAPKRLGPKRELVKILLRKRVLLREEDPVSANKYARDFCC